MKKLTVNILHKYQTRILLVSIALLTVCNLIQYHRHCNDAEENSDLRELSIVQEDLIGSLHSMNDSLENSIAILIESSVDKVRAKDISIGASIIQSSRRGITPQTAAELATIIYDECEYVASIDYAFALAIFTVESRFNINAVSAVGAVGLGQLMPKTAESLARQAGLNFDIDLLSEPRYNVKLSIRYLTYLQKKFNVRKYTAAAYNGGPGGAKRYAAYAEGKASADSVHPETLNYVAAVMEKYGEYKAKFN